MKTRNSKIEIYFCGKKFEVDYYYYPPSPMTMEYPGDDGEFYVNGVMLGKEDMTEFFYLTNLMEELEKKILDTWSNTKNE